MTKEFDKAKDETMLKWLGVLEHVKMAIAREIGQCSFCATYNGCDKCPAKELCNKGLHCDIIIKLKRVRQDIQRGVALLEKVEENSHS